MPRNIKIFLHNPTARIFYILCLIWIFAIRQEANWQAVAYPFISLTIFAVLDLVYTYWKTKKLYYPFSSLVSGLLIGFLIHPSEGLLPIIFACLLGFISKQFLKLGPKNIFNPVAFGVFISSILLNFPVSWSAVASGGILTILPILSVHTIYKLRRLQLSLIFLLGYFLFFSLTAGLKAAFSLTFDGTVFLFAFIMLTEPMTSNIAGFWKYGFSLAVLGVMIINYFLRLNIGDPLLFSLLITNLISRVRN